MKANCNEKRQKITDKPRLNTNIIHDVVYINNLNDEFLSNKENKKCNEHKSDSNNDSGDMKSEYIEYNECSIYEQEIIDFSEMDYLCFVDDDDDHDRNNKKHEEDLSINYIGNNKHHNHKKKKRMKRKNAFANIELSQDSLNQYHLKRNLLIGDIYINNRYELKDGRIGICMYVGPLHFIPNSDIEDVFENEFIGIALEKGIG